MGIMRSVRAGDDAGSDRRYGLQCLGVGSVNGYRACVRSLERLTQHTSRRSRSSAKDLFIFQAHLQDQHTSFSVPGE